MSARYLHGLTLVNQNAGFYHPGEMYDHRTKMMVGQVYISLLLENFWTPPSTRAVAAKARVSRGYASSVIQELLQTGTLVDPETLKQRRLDERLPLFHLSVEEELFLLSLRTENPSRPNLSYTRHLRAYSGTTVSAQFIGKWFETRFDHSGRFCKPNLVPKDKFRVENIVRYMEFRMVLERLPDRTKFHWLDEKHLLNRDVEAQRVRADPLSGYIPCIFVNGDFRDAYNLIAIISGCPTKERPVAYAIGRENGTAASFLVFIQFLLLNSWFERGDILIMDNASIHTGGEADIVEDMLWHAMEVLVVYLPTRSPELNPIELIFHILARRLRSFRYREMAGPCDKAVLDLTCQVLDDLPFDLVSRCIGHCGYYCA
jgi:transposase